MALRLSNNISKMQVGDYVWCKYTATSGVVGIFSDLATKTDAEVLGQEIPIASSATPSGYFRFIMVEDWNGQKRLIADRNVQHNISWDTLNSSGIASGSGLPMEFSEYPNSFAFTTRLLTGGISATDKDNEWDKYIVNSTLNGAITAGDGNVWNSPTTIETWTSTTHVNGNRTTKYVNKSSARPTSLASSSVSFRPVLLIDSVFNLLNKSFILFNGEYKKWVEGSPEKDAVYTNVIPAMTSPTAPSGVASSKGELSATYPAWKAFDKVTNSYFISSSAMPVWISYDFGVGKIIRKYTIKMTPNTGDLAYSPITWTFEGSNDGFATTTILDTRTDVPTWSVSEKREFIVNNSTPFKIYRLYATKTQGNTYLGFDEFEMMEETNPAIPATPSYWKTISTTLPSVDTFKDEGMDDLSVLDRKSTEFDFPMDDNGVSGAMLGEGKVFKEKIDLKKFFDISSIKVK